MTRLDAALAELAEAIRAEVRAEVLAEAGAPDRLLSIPEAAVALGVSRTSLYNELQSGRLRSVVVGKRRRLVPVSAIAERVGRPATMLRSSAVHKRTATSEPDAALPKSTRHAATTPRRPG